ncbi:MAG: hypothetical protein LBR79_03810 [Oscillospiraceae bacterium]|jgi:hypothetical protein|nr:hypothetical protein [Oscillospiraceae bacterium]
MRKEIQKLLEDKDFVEKLLKLKEQSEVKELFATEGGLEDITDDEVEELGQKLRDLIQRVTSLPEDELENIGGGAGGCVDLSGDNDLAKHKRYDEVIAGYKKAGNADIDRLDEQITLGMLGVAFGGLGLSALVSVGKMNGWWGEKSSKCINKKLKY